MKKSSQKTVLLGMSGGVDSSVAALLLKQQGFNVIGAFMKNFSETKNKLTGECAWVDERKNAQKIAAMLDIPLITLDYEKEYKKHVIDPMFKEYARGKTPNPDILCNTIIKFPFLWKAAKEHGADYIATGHYARIKKTKQGYQLLAGKDKNKDQTYFLSELTQKDLEHTLFPIGTYTKDQIRQIAKKNKFQNWDKLGTRGICFVGKQDMQQFLKQKIKEKLGKVTSIEGNILGTHKGASFYTIGQRVGEHIGITITKPSSDATKRYYVAGKKANTLIVAPENHPSLKKKEVHIKKLHSINPNEKIPKSNLKGRIRHLGQLHAGTLIKKGNQYVFTFARPVEAIAEGQFLVIYKGDQLVASGEIRIK